MISTNKGRVYRPKDAERLILYLKDINLPKPDKWGTSMLIAFLQQVCASTLLFQLNPLRQCLHDVTAVSQQCHSTGEQC